MQKRNLSQIRFADLLNHEDRPQLKENQTNRKIGEQKKTKTKQERKMWTVTELPILTNRGTLKDFLQKEQQSLQQAP